MNNKVCAVVVTYNRVDFLKNCINSLLNQSRKPDQIAIVNNNSTDGTKLYLKELEDKHSTIIAINLDQNIGGAGGFKAGIAAAYKKKYTWIWVMDDDAEPEKDCLLTLLNEASQKMVGFLAPLIVNKSTGVAENYHHKRATSTLTKELAIPLPMIQDKTKIRIDANAFVGTLFSWKAIDQVGLPRDDFFIWLDDTEFTYRVSRVFDAFLISNAVIFHNDKLSQNNIVHDFWKYCYGMRNRSIWINSTLSGKYRLHGNTIMIWKFFKLLVSVLRSPIWKGNRKLGSESLLLAIQFAVNNKGGKFIDPNVYHSQIKVNSHV